MAVFNDKYPRLIREEKLCNHPDFYNPVLAVRTGWKDEYGFVKWELGVQYVQITRPSTSVCLPNEERIDHINTECDIHSEQDRQRID